ncbi:SDR family oxidoreductase [Dactylosporangium sp. AC04546]|uniref:SDR family oxidoreductase n=1 Tax=Dactylosporangium sp. AC04546 TaxID=2862460 RepID=UPI001EDCD3D0|nr:SDR family oxidoreductase [Dactylosporangium sp. AC04546]WVK78735.1 SDR family oxidoreductase [Dactylosporangium sp. AC04546]
MRVFVTGASGWIGSATVPELLAAGHAVVGLARSDRAAAALTAAGAEVRRGTLEDLDVLADAAGAADGVIHLAFQHDVAFSGGFQAAAQADRRAVEAMGAALKGSDRPFVLASGLLGLTPGRLATERDGREPEGDQASAGPDARHATARFTLALAERGVRSSVLRLPPTVHGDGDPGFLTAIVTAAREHGVSGYLGDGANRWPAVHRLDAAHLFRLALERAPAGAVLHAAGDEGVAIRAVAEVIGRHLGLPVAPVEPAHFTWLAGLVGIDSPASAALTRDLLGWHPTRPGLLDDLEQGHYFRSAG